ncbi:MAG TPA: hypothetical protein VF179_19195, partial [Thermoanaerobaculia bacterium]|nr:hypothetical protein [Thermoanaerobaculia bacterium]
MIRLVLSLFALTLCLAVSMMTADTTADRLDNLHPAGGTAALTGLERDSHRLLVVGAAVPGNKPARCRARLLDAEGAVLDEAALDVPARSSAQVDFAGRSGLSRAAD